jgi:HD-GYP domain-containing protein (c-di-GMP phosphodiesterase class II)
MLFKKTEDLKVGMRLARPIYNKSGVLLYERNSLLSPQGIASIKNFGLIGIYILEPAEPVPPMTQADLDFERFQTMCVFSIADEMEHIRETKKQIRTHFIAADILQHYGRLDDKINFVQNLRSKEDYIYKHSMNVAIISAMLGNRLNLSLAERNDLVIAGIFHDIGKLSVPAALIMRKEEELDEAEDKQLKGAMSAGYTLLDQAFPENAAVRRITAQYMKMQAAADKGEVFHSEERIMIGAHALLVANTFDSLTAMRYGEPPASEVAALKHLLSNEEIYNKKVTDALVASINILNPGVSVELSNGEKGLVLAENSSDILHPMILCFRDNSILDLGNKAASKGVEILDIMKTLDNRHVMDTSLLKAQGFNVEEPEYVEPHDK